MHFPSTPNAGSMGMGGMSRTTSMVLGSHPTGTTTANTTAPISSRASNIGATFVEAVTAANHTINRQSISGGTALSPKRGGSARGAGGGVGFNLAGAATSSSSAGAGGGASTKNNNSVLNPTLARQLNVRGLETVTMLLAEIGDNGSTIRSSKNTNNLGNKNTNNTTMSRSKSALTTIANGNPNNNTTAGGNSSIEKENQQQSSSNNMALPPMGEPEEELDTVAIATFKQR